MDGTLTVRERTKRNTEQPKALPMLGVQTEKEGRSLILLTCSAGYGPRAGRYTLNGFYDPNLSSVKMVDRMEEAQEYLATVQDWTGTREGDFPKNPWYGEK